MPDSKEEPDYSLDFKLLDQLEPAIVVQRDRAAQVISSMSLERLGPALAFCRLHAYRNGNFKTLQDLQHCEIVKCFLTLQQCAVFERMPHNTSYDPLKIEMCWIPSTTELQDVRWTMFRNRLRKAASASGFSTQTSAAITGAFSEMISNVQEHSDSVDSGIAAYAWKSGQLDYCIIDSGIGVLGSLVTCPEFANLSNHAKALERAITTSVSRFGSQAGRGFGFSQVFKSLQNLYSEMRVHSGDHCLEFSGLSQGEGDRVLRETYDWKGLMVSVSCRPTPVPAN